MATKRKRKCKKHDPVCIDSRPMEGGRRRRYRCRKCDHRWSTVEVPLELKRGPHGSAVDQLRLAIGEVTTERQLKAIRELVASFVDIDDAA